MVNIIDNLATNESYKEWKKRITDEINLIFSETGIEIQMCMIEQGYETLLFGRLMVLFGSGFTAIKLIKNLKNEMKGGKIEC